MFNRLCRNITSEMINDKVRLNLYLQFIQLPVKFTENLQGTKRNFRKNFTVLTTEKHSAPNEHIQIQKHRSQNHRCIFVQMCSESHLWCQKLRSTCKQKNKLQFYIWDNLHCKKPKRKATWFSNFLSFVKFLDNFNFIR